ncbi:uncharacterized protein LOC120698619 isoform X1 [Panicum virgatum]|uniref:uncharacterized protein LOC120698619 isoform X1 n=1 Tax=Panicum virgatum TaxID=38727 RepID=UPI0019D67443|nr:uncharacterized protein LOC120698619 isoform X1 [Panicum virgatum]
MHMRDPFCVGGERRRKNEYPLSSTHRPPEQRPRCRDFPSEAEEGLAPRAESELRCGAEVRGPSNGGRLVGDKKRNEMDNHQDILDLTIRMMQRASIHLMRLSEELLVPGKVLSEVELVDLKFRIEVIADGLDKDSLSCQAALDDVNKGTDDGNLSELIPSDVSSPISPPPVEYLSVKDHIEEFCGVDYDSDAMPNFSDKGC